MAVSSVMTVTRGSSVVGSAAGEDGGVKIWSRAGMLRSTLATVPCPVYAACWSPNSDHVLYTSNRSLVVKPIQPSAKTEQWKAHDQPILALDWNASSNTIVSGGEDRSIRSWNVNTGECEGTMQDAHDGSVVRLCDVTV